MAFVFVCYLCYNFAAVWFGLNAVFTPVEVTYNVLSRMLNSPIPCLSCDQAFWFESWLRFVQHTSGCSWGDAVREIWLVVCLQEMAAQSSTEPKRSIFAREFYHSAGLVDTQITTRPTNQKSAEMSHDPISGTNRLLCIGSNILFA